MRRSELEYILGKIDEDYIKTNRLGAVYDANYFRATIKTICMDMITEEEEKINGETDWGL